VSAQVAADAQDTASDRNALLVTISMRIKIVHAELAVLQRRGAK
jgi:hypothetical protein